jgi:hypothetical protein
MLFQSVISATLALAATANPIIKEEQQPVLSDDLNGQQVDLIKEFVSLRIHLRDLSGQRSQTSDSNPYRLEKANIIPTILDPFGEQQHIQHIQLYLHLYNQVANQTTLQ